MAEPKDRLLLVLQQADSMFPNGSVSFSWGLEALWNRGIVHDRAGLTQFLAAHFKGRWADLDRPALVHAHGASGDLAALCKLDRILEAQSLGVELRLGSARTGKALLGAHARLGTPLAADYLDLIADGRAFGHAALVQGMLWGALGLDCEEVQLMSAHGLCTGVLGAAIRLSAIGHIDAQRIHSQMLPLVHAIMQTPLCEPGEMHCFTPQIDIAAMNHESDEMRLFVN